MSGSAPRDGSPNKSPCGATAAGRRKLRRAKHSVKRRGTDVENSLSSDSSSFSRPCRSSAGSKVGIITTSRLPHTRSDASHSAGMARLLSPITADQVLGCKDQNIPP